MRQFSILLFPQGDSRHGTALSIVQCARIKDLPGLVSLQVDPRF
jgi:hypothetical protein